LVPELLEPELLEPLLLEPELLEPLEVLTTSTTWTGTEAAKGAEPLLLFRPVSELRPTRGGRRYQAKYRLRESPPPHRFPGRSV
jgi:hypothetical protein